jgi:hypothetical protein
MLPAPQLGAQNCRAWPYWNSDAPRAHKLLGLVVLLLVATGLFLRVRGYLFQAPAFWLDECGWAMLLVEQPLSELSIRPMGFILTSQLMARCFGLTEMALRALPWLAGMATTVLAVPLARELFRTWAARLLFVFVIALHPCAIDFSKEFKPYSISLFLHLSLLLFTLLYLRTRLAKHLAWTLATATLGGFFAQDLVFAYPAVFILTGWAALHVNRAQLYAVVATAGVILLCLGGQYLLMWRHVTTHEIDNWATKYSVFYSRASGESPAAWALHHYLDMTGFPGFRRALWNPRPLSRETLSSLALVDRGVWACLHGIGLFVLLRQRRRAAVLLLAPLATLWLFNLLRFWPIGVFRANLFVIGYMTAVACMALDGGKRTAPRLLDALPALLLVFLPLALLDRRWSARKQALTYSSEFPAALEQLLKLKRADGNPRETLLLDRRSCDPFRYYTEFHPRVSKRVGHALRAEFDVHCIDKNAPFRAETDAATPPAPGEVWEILHADRPLREAIRRHRLASAGMRHEVRVDAHYVLAFSAASSRR